MKYSAVIPCGGIGSRLNLGYNKILFKVNDSYLIEKTISNFILDIDCNEIIIVSNSNDIDTLKDILKHPKVKFTLGGSNREESVYNGLKLVSSEYVLIHDGARPNVSKDLIKRIKKGLETKDAVLPIVKSKDATLIDNKYHQSEVHLIQTPQACKTSLLLEAMSNVDLAMFKDDISILSYYFNIDFNVVEGSYSNIKVTTKEDLVLIKEE